MFLGECGELCNFVVMIEGKPQIAGETAGECAAVEAALYLFPVPLSDTSKVGDVLPGGNAGLLRHIRHFLVENVRSARRFIKRVDPSIDVNRMVFTVLDEHTRTEEVAGTAGGRRADGDHF